MLKRHAGFTLIELMVTVAIIGLLAAISVPVYIQFVARSKVTAAASEASLLRTAFQDRLVNGLDINNVSDIGGRNSTDNCSSITASGQASQGVGQITCVIGNAPASVNGQSITWKFNTDESWVCVTSVTASYVPKGCASS